MAVTIKPTQATPEPAVNDAVTTVPALSYPFTDPATETERLVHRLNSETFPVELYGRVDDILTYSLLKKKSWKSKADKTFQPQRVFPAERPTNRVMQQLFPTIQPIFDFDPLNAEEKGMALGRLLSKDHAEMFPPDSRRCIEHLAIRYTLFRTWVAPFAALRKDYSSGNIMAIKDIPMGTVVLELCSSMSSDEFQPSPEIASPHELPLVRPQVEGTPSPRLLLGPLRFVQHDCEPNCEVIQVPNTHAYGIRTLCDIETGHHLTVDRRIAPYTGYNVNTECHCRTCVPPPQPLVVPTPAPPATAEGEATPTPKSEKVDLPSNSTSSNQQGSLKKRKRDAEMKRLKQELVKLEKEEYDWQEREQKKLKRAEREEMRYGLGATVKGSKGAKV